LKFIFFANILPGIAFALDLIETTGQYGVQEILLATVGSNLGEYELTTVPPSGHLLVLRSTTTSRQWSNWTYHSVQ
jgi:hypothetical protein